MTSPLNVSAPNLCQPEGVKEGGGVQCFLVYRARASSFQQTVMVMTIKAYKEAKLCPPFALSGSKLIYAARLALQSTLERGFSV